MRKAIYTKLCEIVALGSRVYQSYTAPENSTTPYCTVKMLGEDEVFDNKKASIWPFSIFIYVSPDSFISLDTLVIAVKEKLNNVTLTTTESESFTPEHRKTLEDFHDDQRNLFSKRIDFDIGAARK